MKRRKPGPLTCDGCTLCCQGETVFLKPDKGDDVELYKTVTKTNPITKRLEFMIEQRENGDCIYLSRDVGCTIHDRKPLVCRNLDCRKWLYPEYRERMERLQKMAGASLLREEQLEAARRALKRCGPIPRKKSVDK